MKASERRKTIECCYGAITINHLGDHLELVCMNDSIPISFEAIPKLCEWLLKFQPKEKDFVLVELDNISRSIVSDVVYSLDLPHIENVDDSVAINHCLGEIHAFEHVAEDQITNHLRTNYLEKYKHYLQHNNIAINSTTLNKEG